MGRYPNFSIITELFDSFCDIIIITNIDLGNHKLGIFVCRAMCCCWLSVMTIKWFKSPYSWVIHPLIQPQVANQQKIDLGNVKKLHQDIFNTSKIKWRQATNPSSKRGSPENREEKITLQPWRTIYLYKYSHSM